MVRREHSTAIAHNKFIVASHEGAPVAVWTGSTNITEGGIFGHMRLFTHYEFRHAITKPRPTSATRSLSGQAVTARKTLQVNDTWAQRWYQPHSAREKERHLFAGI